MRRESNFTVIGAELYSTYAFDIEKYKVASHLIFDQKFSHSMTTSFLHVTESHSTGDDVITRDDVSIIEALFVSDLVTVKNPISRCATNMAEDMVF